MISIARTLGAPRDGAGRERRLERVERVLAGRERAGHVAHDVHDVAVVLDLHELVDGHRARRAHAAEVVAAQVDEHDVLGALLLVGEQVGAQAPVLGGAWRRAGACRRADA